MSKQINNALSISRESGTSVKSDTHCFTWWPSQHPNVPPPPTNRMTDSNFTNDRQQFYARLRKDQQFSPSPLPPQLCKSQQGSGGRCVQRLGFFPKVLPRHRETWVCVIVTSMARPKGMMDGQTGAVSRYKSPLPKAITVRNLPGYGY